MKKIHRSENVLMIDGFLNWAYCHIFVMTYGYLCSKSESSGQRKSISVQLPIS